MIYSPQIRKAYPDGGGMEAHEEMARMREHAMEEVSCDTINISV